MSFGDRAPIFPPTESSRVPEHEGQHQANKVKQGKVEYIEIDGIEIVRALAFQELAVCDDGGIVAQILSADFIVNQNGSEISLVDVDFPVTVKQPFLFFL